VFGRIGLGMRVSAQQAVTVTMKDFEFQPKSLTVAAGTTVTWVNGGTKKHSATADDGSFDTGLFAPGESKSVKFDKPGTFPYYCQLHGGPNGDGMSATIVVTGADQSQDAQAATEAAATAAPANAAAGNAVTFANKAKNADAVTVSIKGFTPLASGHVFQAWLVDAQGKPFSLGQMNVAADGSATVTYADAKGTNLVGAFGQALVTDQPGGNLTKPGTVVYSGAIPAKALIHVRHVLAAFPDTPKNVGLLPGAFANIKVLQAHVGLAQKSLAANDLSAVRLHLEHIYNIALGVSAGKDLNENGKIDNPPDADGFGVIPYLQRASDHAKLAAEADDANDRIKLHAVNVQAGAKNAIDRLTQITVLAQSGEDAGNLAGAKPIVDKIAQLAADTVKADGNMNSANAEALAMAAMDLSTAGATPPDAAPPAAATEAAAAPVEGSAQTVTMADFQFNPKEITITVGTTVTWVNNGTKKHSATADDGSFDTGLFAPGESKSVTFDKPGTFPYYCQLHGDKGGTAMSGVVVVK
jgi:plastocyanin